MTRSLLKPTENKIKRTTKIATTLELFLPVFFIIFFSKMYLDVALIASSRSIDYGRYLASAWDLKIPFIPLFIIPYICAWIFVPLCLYYITYHQSIYFFRRACLSILTLSIVLVFCYIAFPVHYPFRVKMAQFSEPSIFLDMILYNYQYQPAWNEFPSSHIAIPWLTLRMMSQTPFKGVTILFNLYFLLLATSVIAIKIHFILDILGGIIVAELVHQRIFKRFDEYPTLYKLQSKNILFFSLIIFILVLFILSFIKLYLIN